LTFRVPEASCSSKRRGFDFVREIPQPLLLALAKEARVYANQRTPPHF
jgi:hypothetical protein